jgi:SAM-dependent methyltransferase
MAPVSVRYIVNDVDAAVQNLHRMLRPGGVALVTLPANLLALPAVAPVMWLGGGPILAHNIVLLVGFVVGAFVFYNWDTISGWLG